MNLKGGKLAMGGKGRGKWYNLYFFFWKIKNMFLRKQERGQKSIVFLTLNATFDLKCINPQFQLPGRR